jgi:DNA-binding GntR family transcriptional regulator
MRVCRRDRRPLYQKIADDLRSQITTGRYSPHDHLPSLRELCTTYRVSKVTASSALTLLDQQGLIAVRHGLRSVVLTPQTNPDQGDLNQVRQQVSAMAHRQEQIVEQVHSLEETLRRIAQQVHQLRQQGTAPRQPPESPPDSPDPSAGQPCAPPRPTERPHPPPPTQTD